MCLSENSFPMGSSINVIVQSKSRQVLKICRKNIANPKYMKILKRLFTIKCN